MNKRILLSALAGSVASFLAGWLVYGILGMDAFMKSHMTHYEGLDRPMDGMMMTCIFLSGFVSSYMLAYILDTWAHISNFMGGLKVGMIVTFCICVSYDLFFYGALNLYSTTAIIADICIGTIMGGVIAGVIAWTQGKLGASAA